MHNRCDEDGDALESVVVVVRCWGCSAKLQPPPPSCSSSSIENKNASSSSHHRRSEISAKRNPYSKFLCGHCGAINSVAQAREFGEREKNKNERKNRCSCERYCLVLPARCCARTMGRILIPTVVSLVYFLVSRTYAVSIPKLTTEREVILSGEMERTAMDWAMCFALRGALMLACANIYWNYASSIFSPPKSIRRLREDGEGSEGENDGEDVESGRSRNASSSSSSSSSSNSSSSNNRNGIMPLPWCQQQQYENLEVDTRETDVETGGTETRHPTTVVPRDSFRNCAYCIKCDDVKPFGTSHCSTCNKCIVDLDHHCPFLQNCVGKHNVRAFTCFCLWCSLGCALAFVVAILLPFTSQRATFMKPYEKIMSGTDKYSNYGKNAYEHIGHFPTSTGALIQYCSFALKYVSACEDTWIGTWSIVVVATATIAPLTFGLFYQTYMAVKRGEFYVASLKAKREREERGGSFSPKSMARDAAGLSTHIEEARVRAVFERTKGEHWVFWFLFPRVSRTGRLGRRKGGSHKVQ